MRYNFLVVTFLNFWLISGFSYADNQVRLATKVWDPYQVNKGDGQVKGKSVDLLNCVFDKIGYEAKYSFFPGSAPKNYRAQVRWMVSF